MSEIISLEPVSVWRNFDAITRIPRPSGKEEKITEFLVKFAATHSLPCRKDGAGNVVITRPASRKNAPVVVLQSHIDMVCEKNAGVEFDFERDPIRTVVDGGWVRAEGTTLGADDGIGMAAALAVLEADTKEFPTIEALFTVDEETGLTGAANLGDGMISGKYLINLDSEEEGELYIGCAGGITTTATFTYKEVKASRDLVFFRIEVSGLKGGHSGSDIEKGRGNSNRILARLLAQIEKSTGLVLSWFDGGDKHNAIPREAYCIFGVPAKKVKTMFEVFDTFSDEICSEYRASDPDLILAVSEMPLPATVIDDDTCRALLTTLCGVPDGVIAMSRTMENLVETSTNLASVKFSDKNRIAVLTSQRSSSAGAIRDIASTVAGIFAEAGAEVAQSEGYPGWEPNPGSELLAKVRKCYRELFGNEPKIRATHAGLECGLLLEKHPGMDMVSFGPTLEGVHSPDERLEIGSVERFWKLLVEVLKTL